MIHVEVSEVRFIDWVTGEESEGYEGHGCSASVKNLKRGPFGLHVLH